jgi:hypothetical protein
MCSVCFVIRYCREKKMLSGNNHCTYDNWNSENGCSDETGLMRYMGIYTGLALGQIIKRKADRNLQPKA